MSLGSECITRKHQLLSMTWFQALSALGTAGQCCQYQGTEQLHRGGRTECAALGAAGKALWPGGGGRHKLLCQLSRVIYCIRRSAVH